MVGYLVLIGGDALGIGSRFAPALAAVVIGLLARVVALRMGAPQLVVAVPAALILLPGLTIFRSMYVLTIEESEILMGAGGMLNAGAIVLGVAAGIVLGDTLARPLTRSLASNERRRRAAAARVQARWRSLPAAAGFPLLCRVPTAWRAAGPACPGVVAAKVGKIRGTPARSCRLDLPR